MSSWDEQWKSVGAEWNSSCGPSVEKKAIIKNDAGIGRPLALATKDRLVANGKAADLDDYFTFTAHLIHDISTSSL